MKLIMYSGNITDEISKFIKLLSNDDPVLTIIPSDSKHPKINIFMNNLRKIFENLGIKNINYYPIDNGIFDLDIYKKSDIIYLSGGDTEAFFNNLKLNGDFNKLKEFVINGGLIIGLSAGSIIMTPNIGIDNCEKEGLNLVDFEFFPHYSELDSNFLLEYSKNNGNIIYGVPNNSGIVLDGDNIYLLGGKFIKKFYKGNIII